MVYLPTGSVVIEIFGHGHTNWYPLSLPMNRLIGVVFAFRAFNMLSWTLGHRHLTWRPPLHSLDPVGAPNSTELP